jgi:hypothetical protein
MRRVTILLVLGVFALAVAGCGGGSSSSNETSTTTTTTETTTSEETTTATETSTEASGLGGLASGDCHRLSQASAALGTAIASSGQGGDLGSTAEAYQKYVDEAPEEIRPDVQVLADAYAKYASALQDAGLKAGETPSTDQALKIGQALASLDQQKIATASANIATWAQKNCTS